MKYEMTKGGDQYLKYEMNKGSEHCIKYEMTKGMTTASNMKIK